MGTNKKYYYHAELNEYTPTTLHQLIISDEVKSFPPFYFQGVDGRLKGRKILSNLLLTKLEWEKEKIPQKLDKDLIKKYKLSGLLVEFNNNLCDLCNFVFEEHWKPWQFKKLPSGVYSNGDIKKEIIDWLVLDCISNEIAANQNNILEYIEKLTVKQLHKITILDVTERKDYLNKLTVGKG